MEELQRRDGEGGVYETDTYWLAPMQSRPTQRPASLAAPD
jgi:hypothetical protein